jgi:hypothetical protein
MLGRNLPAAQDDARELNSEFIILWFKRDGESLDGHEPKNLLIAN